MNWKKIVKKFNLGVEHPGREKNICSKYITRTNFEFLQTSLKSNCQSIVLWGKEEFEFLMSLETQKRIERVEAIFKMEPPMIVVSKSFKIEPSLLALAKKYDVTIASTVLPSQEAFVSIGFFLIHELADYKTFHANLLVVYGLGVMIIGDSAIGKSEVSLDLIKKGHMLVADDAVECANVLDKIVARPAEFARGFMEIRGVGIINVSRVLGIEKFKSSTEIDVIIELCNFDPVKVNFERLGKEIQYKDLLGVKIPHYSVPVSPGRNVRDIIEVIVANLKLIETGYNSFDEFRNKSSKSILK